MALVLNAFYEYSFISEKGAHKKLKQMHFGT